METRSGRALLEPLDGLFRTGTLAGVSDKELLERFLTRHDEFAEAAFEALVLRHGPMVLGVCRRLLHDSNDADDAFQATFLVLLRKAGSVRNGVSVAAWLHGVARRIALHARAEAVRRSEVEQRAGAGARLASADGSGQAALDLWDEVDRLPGNLRAAVTLCYLEGLTHEEAAARLDWPVGTIRSRLARARAQLRSRLERKGLAPDVAVLPLLAVKSPPVPARLIGPLVEAATVITARDAAEAGLVSASVASLAEGAHLAMSITKFKAAAAMLITAGCLAWGAVYAYQDPTPRGRDASAETRPESAERETRLRERLEGRGQPEVRRDEPESLASRIVVLAKRALERQEQGEIGPALEALTGIQKLAEEWRGRLLRDSERREGPAARGRRPGSTRSPDGDRESEAARRALGDVERRLDELETMMRQVMRAMEADRRRVDGNGAPRTKGF